MLLLVVTGCTTVQFVEPRPLILLEKVHLIEPLKVGSRVYLTWEATNVGAGVATNVKAGTEVTLGQEPVAVPDKAGKSPSVSVLGPSRMLPSPDAPSVWLNGEAGRLWTDDDARRAAAGERLYLQVVVYYDDLKGKSHVSAVCGYWEGAAITACPTGNLVR